MGIEKSMKIKMTTLQELFGNLEEHNIKLKIYSKVMMIEKGKTLPLITTTFEKEKDDLKSLKDLNKDDHEDIVQKDFLKLCIPQK